jgi:hypothetical protein
MSPLLRTATVALAICALCATSFAASKKNRPQERERHPTANADEADKKNHEADALLSAIQSEQSSIHELIVAIKGEQIVQREKDRADDEPFSWFPHLGSLKVQQGLLIVGFFYTLFAGWQLVEIHRQANIAERTLNLVERPYLGYQIKRVFWKDAGIEYVRLRVDYSLINSGRTPARITDHNSVLCRTSSKERPQEAPYDPSAEQRITGLTVPAGRQHEASTWLQLPKREAQIVQMGVEGTNAFVHFFAHVDYKDGLDKPHASYLCGIVTLGRLRERDLYLTFPRSHQYKEDT